MLVSHILLRSQFWRDLGETSKRRIFNAMSQVKPRDVIAGLQGIDRLWVLRPLMSSERYQHVDGQMREEVYERLDYDAVDCDRIDVERSQKHIQTP